MAARNQFAVGIIALLFTPILACAEDAWETDPAQSVYEDQGEIADLFSPINLGRDNPLMTSAIIHARMYAMRGKIKDAMKGAATSYGTAGGGEASAAGVCSVAAGPNTRVVINNCLVNGAIIGGR